MKEEWKVYIKGVQGRGKEVIKILTDLGGKESNSYLTGANKRGIYYIQHNLMISFAAMNTEMSKIIMDNYKEIKLPEQWKNGDILISKDGTDYKVFWEYDFDSNTQFYAYNVSMRVNGMLSRYIQRFREDYRLATPSEVEHFHELLHNLNRDWDSEKREIVDWKWKPKKNEKYWFISFSGNIIECIWTDSPDDKTCFNFGNCFHTREEAKAMAEKINKLLNE